MSPSHFRSSEPVRRDERERETERDGERDAQTLFTLWFKIKTLHTSKVRIIISNIIVRGGMGRSTGVCYCLIYINKAAPTES